MVSFPAWRHMAYLHKSRRHSTFRFYAAHESWNILIGVKQLTEGNTHHHTFLMLTVWIGAGEGCQRYIAVHNFHHFSILIERVEQQSQEKREAIPFIGLMSQEVRFSGIHAFSVYDIF